MNKLIYFHRESGVHGTIEATSSHPDGKVLWRLDDHWFFAEDCQATYETL